MQEVVGSTPILSTYWLCRLERPAELREGRRFDPDTLHRFKAPKGAFVMSYVTYIIYSTKLDKYYIGSCENILTRINQHNTARNKSTKPGVPWSIKYTKEFATRSEAQQWEMEVKKKKSRKYIEWLIGSVN